MLDESEKGLPVATVRMTEDEIWRYVESAHTGIFTSLRRDGVPISLPIWFVCLDRTLYLSGRGRKLTRVRSDPRTAFLVESGEHWADLKAVHFTGTAEVIELEGELAHRFTRELDHKYSAFRSAAADMPTATAAVYAQRHDIIRFRPDDRVLHWDNSKLAVR